MNHDDFNTFSLQNWHIFVIEGHEGVLITFISYLDDYVRQ